MTDITIGSEEELDALLAKDIDVVVLFTAPKWCQPCKQIKPHWEVASTKVDMLFAVVDTGATPEDTANHWASRRFNIMGVPQIKLFRRGSDEVVDIKGRNVVPLMTELRGFE